MYKSTRARYIILNFKKITLLITLKNLMGKNCKKLRRPGQKFARARQGDRMSGRREEVNKQKQLNKEGSWGGVLRPLTFTQGRSRTCLLQLPYERYPSDEAEQTHAD